MARRLFQRAAAGYQSSRQAVQTASEVIEEHKSLLWLVGTGSSALAGWAIYTARRLHYQRIQGDMNQIVAEIKGIKQKEEEVSASMASASAAASSPSQLRLLVVLVPAVLSAFLFGYMVGRTTMSFHWHKQVRINKSLGADRVYVAVVPERLFEASMVAKELERAVAKADREAATHATWLSQFLGGSSAAAKEPSHTRPPRLPPS